MDRKTLKKHSFWQDGDDFEWHVDDDGWYRSYPFGYAKVVDLMDWGAEGYGVQVYGYDGKLWEMVGVTTPQAAMGMADEKAEQFDLIGDGSIMSASKRAFVAGYMAAQKVVGNLEDMIADGVRVFMDGGMNALDDYLEKCFPDDIDKQEKLFRLIADDYKSGGSA